jgi:hypothetical protein
MIGTEMHVVASVWQHCQVPDRHPGRFRWSRESDLAVLVMEGEVADRLYEGALAEDALYRAVMSRGLTPTTDLDDLNLRRVFGWRVVVDEFSAVTIKWPHVHPLLTTAPVDLPEGWLEAAKDLGFVLVVAGYGLSLAGGPIDEQLSPRLERAARAGALAAGAVTTQIPKPRVGS